MCEKEQAKVLVELLEASQTIMRVLESEDMDESFDGECTILRDAIERAENSVPGYYYGRAPMGL